MEKFNIYVDISGLSISYDVIQKGHAWCEFEVFDHGQLIATFQPDQEERIRVYLNFSNLTEEILRSISLKIEEYYQLHP